MRFLRINCIEIYRLRTITTFHQTFKVINGWGYKSKTTFTVVWVEHWPVEWMMIISHIYEKSSNDLRTKIEGGIFLMDCYDNANIVTKHFHLFWFIFTHVLAELTPLLIVGI